MSQRMRKNGSPSNSNATKPGPLKAVKAFSLKNSGLSRPNSSSDSRSSNASPTSREIIGSERARVTRKSPDQGSSSEARSPVSSNQKDKGRYPFGSSVPYNLPVSASLPYGASSADPSVPYLTGQWPKNITSYHHYHSGGVFMCDKSTQTVYNAEQILRNKKHRSHRRSSSLEHVELSKETIKQRLQKSKEVSRQEGGRLRCSPVAGVHYALSVPAPLSPRGLLSPHAAPIPPRNLSRFQRGSVEALNVEIEGLVLSKPGSSALHGQEDPDIPLIPVPGDVPDGHRAPVPEASTGSRSVDTQTPSSPSSNHPLSMLQGDAGSDSDGDGGPDTLVPSGLRSPPDPFLYCSPQNQSGSQESKSSSKVGNRDGLSPELSKYVHSPRAEQKCPFVREPPDGCEKVKVIEETRRPSLNEQLSCPLKPQFVFQQSQHSAFCPLN